MITVLLVAIAAYIALGIAVLLTLNYAFVMPEGRLRKVRDGVPLVLAWPIVLYVLWALNH
jgi:hypothetical protein